MSSRFRFIKNFLDWVYDWFILPVWWAVKPQKNNGDSGEKEAENAESN